MCVYILVRMFATVPTHINKYIYTYIYTYFLVQLNLQHCARPFLHILFTNSPSLWRSFAHSLKLCLNMTPLTEWLCVWH